eukprot:354545-Chlamydomonas_euryale.AAC.1
MTPRSPSRSPAWPAQPNTAEAGSRRRGDDGVTLRAVAVVVGSRRPPRGCRAALGTSPSPGPLSAVRSHPAQLQALCRGRCRVAPSHTHRRGRGLDLRAHPAAARRPGRLPRLILPIPNATSAGLSQHRAAPLAAGCGAERAGGSARRGGFFSSSTRTPGDMSLLGAQSPLLSPPR